MPRTRPQKQHQGLEQALAYFCVLPLAALLRKPPAKLLQDPAMRELAAAMREEAARVLDCTLPRGKIALAKKTGRCGKTVPSLDAPAVRGPLAAWCREARRTGRPALTLERVHRILERLRREIRRP
ncbi:MAG: hypothetical protein WCU88_03345 [Elusimicrobiota bacterium]|jgi:hypothetical protein